jgi:hypothetical protein
MQLYKPFQGWYLSQSELSKAQAYVEVGDTVELCSLLLDISLLEAFYLVVQRLQRA